MTNFDFEQAILALKDKYGRTWPQATINEMFKYCHLNRKDKDDVLEVLKGLVSSSKRLPTKRMFVRALYAKERELRRARFFTTPCKLCGNGGLVSVALYTDLDRYDYRLASDQPPGWYEELPENSKQPVTTEAMRCKCGRNQNPRIPSYVAIS